MTSSMIAKIALRAIVLAGLTVTAVDAAAQGRGRERRPVPGRIETHIDRFEPARRQTTGNGWQHFFIPPGMADTLTVKLSTVYKGTATHDPHSHFPDETFYIVRGPVRVHIDGEERVLRTGDFYYTPSGSRHNIQRTSERDTIQYLMFMRETDRPLDKPFRARAGYTFDDCVTHPSADPQWTADGDAQSELLDAGFADGMRVVMDRVASRGNVLSNAPGAGKTALYILSGRGIVTLDGRRARIERENAVICPRGSTYSIRKTGREPLVLLTVTTP